MTHLHIAALPLLGLSVLRAGMAHNLSKLMTALSCAHTMHCYATLSALPDDATYGLFMLHW